MFNNIIYFIIVLLIFNISYTDSSAQNSFSATLFAFVTSWMIFAGYCRWGFRRLLMRYADDKEGRLTGEYQGLVGRLSILAIMLFALDVYILRLKYWLQILPGVKHFTVLEGAIALAIFMFYLATVWYFSYTAYRITYQSDIPRRSLIISNVKLNLPILFPWLTLALLLDVISLLPWSGPVSFLNTTTGQMLFFACFLIVLMIFLPHLVQYWWGCRPFEPSDKTRELESFLSKKGFKYRQLLKWPIFEGRIMTAGIMGIVPRYRYLLVTESLMEILTLVELKAVLAHEMGHAKYRHLLLYFFFFLGYMVLSIGLLEVFSLFLATQPFFLEGSQAGGSGTTDFFYFLLALPLLISMFVYFRYVMGFFMRHFERQADIFSAVQLGSPGPTISSLEKIAFMSGKSRALPSWHHFSIKERVDYLWRLARDPGLMKKHNQFVALVFSGYLVLMAGFGYFLNFSPLKESVGYHYASKFLTEQLAKDPQNILLMQQLADIRYQQGKYLEAIEAYERIIHQNPEFDAALNNLAWYLVTVPDEALRDPPRALTLAKQAVALKRSPIFLDTLAEAYFANGLIREAIRTIEEALIMESGDKSYYKKQRRKFLAHGDGSLRL
ncbi:M48 family metalloprotease [Thermodesulfobacteriota bacterium]